MSGCRHGRSLMKKHKKCIAVIMSGVLSVSVLGGLTGCGWLKKSPSMPLDELALDLALSMMGDDAFAWNAFSATPYETYGYVSEGDPSWYSYSGTRSNLEITMINYLFNTYYSELQRYDKSKLNEADMATYRTMDYILDTYRTYYKSKYVNDFELLGGSYISSEGGYVADFASSFENFTFRTEKDVKILLTVTQSTEQAFGTYLSFASDRAKAGYPLYDYTITAMQDYLNDVYDKGDDYYLYAVADKKIDDADFLSAASKTTYKIAYKAAIDDNYMQGVRELSHGLDAYKGKAKTSDKSYLAAAGAKGKAYYEWLFRQKTGIKNANLTNVYNELVTAYSGYYNSYQSVKAQADALETTDKATYDEFYAYYNEEKVLLDLTDPTEILEYLKVAAKDIVPDLDTTPEIGFKYMDDTVAEISNTLAYYVRTPLDQQNSKEMITLNAYQSEKNPSDLLTTIAHEGYPGHLYAYVNAKEQGASLLSTCMSCGSFSEGWANYTELALLESIAAKTTDTATQLYCNYKRYQILCGYMSMLLYDMQVNYFGETVEQEILEMLMEIPAGYVPYGYGLYTMATLHDKAKQQLGSKYSEVEFNGALLGEGFGPTLARASEITDNFIAQKKKSA